MKVYDRWISVSGLKLVTVLLTGLMLAGACKKEKTTAVNTPVPFLTGRTWQSDTITINAPATYALLSPADQNTYRTALAFFKNTFLRFNENGTITNTGDFDFGYLRWHLTNADRDIQVERAGDGTETLRNWAANTLQLTYTVRFNDSFDVTMVFK